MHELTAGRGPDLEVLTSKQLLREPQFLRFLVDTRGVWTLTTAEGLTVNIKHSWASNSRCKLCIPRILAQSTPMLAPANHRFPHLVLSAFSIVKLPGAALSYLPHERSKDPLFLLRLPSSATIS